MKFSIIGTGNMAWFLAEKLKASGHTFEGIFGRNAVAAEKIATKYGTIVYNHPGEIPDLQNHCCFLAVKDTAIPELAAQLQFSHTILLHTAGASSINILNNAARNNAAFWPVYSLLKNSTSLPSNIPIAIEGNNGPTEQSVFKLAKSISGNAFLATEKQRLTLHLSAVFANNFTNHLLAIAEDICATQHISFDYLKPILAQTFGRLNKESAKRSQTGPAIRGDEVTMQQHLTLLSENQDLTELYQTLSMSIRKMYESDAQ